ncbi:hypothetical protein EJ08DRAFT_574888, partial [Tothia fuscella]
GDYVGLMPKSAVVSDEIFMLKDAVLPVVLRHSAENPGRFRFIGICYVHGV